MKKMYLELFLVFFFSSFTMWFILWYSGTITSGYHFRDDHELINIEYTIKQEQNSIDSIVISTIQNDMQTRFRPFYWLERVVGTAIFGSNLLYWNYYKAIMAVITFCLLYYTSKNLGHKWCISIIFACIIMLGEQITPWYRSANQENTGLFVCALTLFFISKQAYDEKYYSFLYNTIICITVLIGSLIKESFILMIPAYVGLKFWLEYSHLSMYNVGLKGIWKQCLKNNAVIYIILTIVMLWELYLLLFGVGVDKVSYAGFQSGFNLKDYWMGIRYSLLIYLKWYFLFGVLLSLMVLVCYQVIEVKLWKIYLGFGLIGIYITSTQLVAHSKSMMWERYIIPFIIGYAMIFVLLGYKLLAQDKFRRRVYVITLIVLLLLKVPVAYKSAVAYAQDGDLIQGYLSFVLENTNSDSDIIGAYTDGEMNLATACWLEIHNRTKEFFYNWETETLIDEVQLTILNEGSTTWDTADAVLCYSQDVDRVISMMELEENEEYQRLQYGAYAVIIR